MKASCCFPLLLSLVALFALPAPTLAQSCPSLNFTSYSGSGRVTEGSEYYVWWYATNLGQSSVYGSTALLTLPAGTTCLDVTPASANITIASDNTTEVLVSLARIKPGAKVTIKVRWLFDSICLTGPVISFLGTLYQNINGSLVCPVGAPVVVVRELCPSMSPSSSSHDFCT